MAPNPTETTKFDANSKPEKPLTAKVAGEKAPIAPPKTPAEKVNFEFQTDSEKGLFIKNFDKLINQKFNDFSERFKKNFADKDGKLDLPKLLTSMGLYTPTIEKIIKGGESVDTGSKVQYSKKEGQRAIFFDKSPGTFSSSDKSPYEFDGASKGKIPERPTSALTGSQFMAEMDNFGNMNSKANQKRMEDRILEEIRKGNIPTSSRNMIPITMPGPDGTKVIVRAAADYISIGSNNDSIRVPMTPLLAQRLSSEFGWGMPTATLTEAIYKSANIKVEPGGLVSKQEDQNYMQGNNFIRKHNDRINGLLGTEGMSKVNNGEALVAGHKKDVIISAYALSHPGKLDFRGLFANGKAIQTNPAHEDTYRDYSHGFRPIDGNITIVYPDGRSETKPYYQALSEDSRIASVLNGAEGKIAASSAYRPKSNNIS